MRNQGYSNATAEWLDVLRMLVVQGDYTAEPPLLRAIRQRCVTVLTAIRHTADLTEDAWLQEMSKPIVWSDDMVITPWLPPLCMEIFGVVVELIKQFIS